MLGVVRAVMSKVCTDSLWDAQGEAKKPSRDPINVGGRFQVKYEW